MGEYADYILNGDDCQECGAYIGDGDGYPRSCPSCAREERAENRRGNRPFYCVKNLKTLDALDEFLAGVHYTYTDEGKDKVENPLFRLMFDKYPQKDHAFGVQTRGIVVVVNRRFLETVTRKLQEKRRPE